MGWGRWTSSDWDAYASRTTTGRTTAEIFANHGLDPDLDPRGVGYRESCDSTDNPQSTAIIVGLDVTGSMHTVLDAMARKGLNTLATAIYDRKPVPDPHVMFMGIGDVEAGDRAPLQVTQFEADIRIAKQLAQIYLEGGGGGNNHESYLLPWYFAALHTRIDCLAKRGKKGYLFTIGDEEPQLLLKAPDVLKVLGTRPNRDLSAETLLNMVSRQYEVFHVMVEEGSYYQSCGRKVDEAWRRLLGQRALRLSDHTKLAEVIVSAIQVHEGALTDQVCESWDGSTRSVVKRALQGLASRPSRLGSLIRFA